MVRSLLAVFASMAFLSGVPIGESGRAEIAMQPAALRVTGSPGFVQMAVNICGNAGCVPVQTKRLNKHQLPKTTQPQAQPAAHSFL